MPSNHLESALDPSDNILILPVVTLVLWTLSLLAGLLGFVLPYARPRLVLSVPEPVNVQQVPVELDKTPEPPPPVRLTLPDNPAEPSPPQDVVVPLVAQPSPTIAFAVPIEGPTRVVPASRADYGRPATQGTSAGSLPMPQNLTFGQGEGRQPKPEYPSQAVRQGQEGTVLVRCVVAPNGEVTSAEAIEPCPWPLLNDSAVRTVRQRWHFEPGELRVYDVAIRFQRSKS